jgi:hypothetical protein
MPFRISMIFNRLVSTTVLKFLDSDRSISIFFSKHFLNFPTNFRVKGLSILAVHLRLLLSLLKLAIFPECDTTCCVLIHVIS